MDGRRLGGLCAAIGFAGILGSLLWWVLYGLQVTKLGAGPQPPLVCAVYAAETCQAARSGLWAAGYPPYEPLVLWMFAALTALGFVVRLSSAALAAPQDETARRIMDRIIGAIEL